MSLIALHVLVALASLVVSTQALSSHETTITQSLNTLHAQDAKIFYHGRWDFQQGTWWAGSGLKLHANNMQSLDLHLGAHTTSPVASLGVSVNYGPYITVNVSSGSNSIPLGNDADASVVRIVTEGWQNNRIQLESLTTNHDARLQTYVPSQVRLQIIGDSLSAVRIGLLSGQYLPQGVVQAWPFLTAESLKAELNVNAQPGAALKDIPAWGNVHGVSYEFFRTEDTGYYYTTDHNFTTPWDFAKDDPPPTHIMIHIGANDASQNVTSSDFEQTYLNFVSRLRTIYHTQPIFVFTPISLSTWGWPAADGSISYYYTDSYPKIVQERRTLGDKNVFLVNTTGWIRWEDVFPDNIHPTVSGHQRVAGFFEDWLKGWGLTPEVSWPTHA
ncbi:SGNH hydrolase-type esterase domain-containing protein [Irpex rosettiformis]|uniref:SGNH hydrolase-type esterase domain-containing protein n=1 Tax=Irpex rosettiformis TaxID=378272 RepID=A0ACB8TZL9_9APHY|nr:SGNH hydrolase-type esterase domain-containing protein [Irpex rosettiformis]